MRDVPAVEIKLAIDMDMIGLVGTEHPELEYQYIRGPHFNDDLDCIPEGVTCHENEHYDNVFSNLLFMFAFLPANIICYFLSRNLKTKNIILIVFSLLFYAWGEPVCVALLIFSSFIGYIFAIAIDKSETKQQKKLYLIISLIINLGLLGIFKYAGFFVSNINYLLHVNLPVPQISLPIGISFYTFQIVSYVIDVYCNRVDSQKSFAKFLMYVSLYPQLIAGPIIRYIDIEKEIDNREVNISNISQGINRFIIG